jgi:quinoprotein glucose dehydrogenase
MKTSRFRTFRPAMALLAVLFATLPRVGTAVPDAVPQQQRQQAPIAASPQIPPLEIPEEHQEHQFALVRMAFDREFDLPVELAVIPGGGGEQVLAMQRGEFCAMNLDGTSHWRPFLDFRKKMAGLLLFEEGVHGIAFHPRFSENRLVYLSYSQNEPRRTVISEMRASAGANPVAMPETERIILEVPQPLADHWGGHIAFGPDGFLYIALGDGGLRDDPYRLAQNPWVLHGKILRLDVNSRTGNLPYGIPDDNPFVKEQAVRHEIFALGLRNPWGLSFDSQTGQLWLADVGQDLWEEINRIDKGGNYGWSDRDGPTKSIFHSDTFKATIPTTDPVHAYTRMRAEGLCIIGGLLYRGNRLPGLDGAFLFADWAFGTIWGLAIDPQSRTAAKRIVLHRRGDSDKFNPTLVTADAEGEPILLSQEGAIYRLEDASD